MSELTLNKTWIGLFLCNLAWAMNPSAAKIIIGEIGPEFTAWFKYTGALIAYFVIISLVKLRKIQYPKQIRFFIKPKTRQDLKAVLSIGLTTCFLSPLTQMKGLTSSTAINNSLLVSFEPLFIVFFSWILLGERLYIRHIASFCLALFGFALLSKLPQLYSGTGIFFQSGDLMLLGAIGAESIYSVLGKDLTKSYPPREIFGSAITIGAALLTLIISIQAGSPPLSALTVQGWIAIAWLGPIGTAATYLFWLYSLNQGLGLSSIVLTLFLQPVFGAIAGSVLLHEPLEIHQSLGAALIIFAVLLQIRLERRTKRALTH